MSYVDQPGDGTPSGNPGGTGKPGGSSLQDIPVNPYSLLEAVNASSVAARGGWVLFLAIVTFILIAVAGVTHRDLLLNSNVDLPILQVEIELTRFFLFAPVLLLFVHFGMLIQHVMLSRKTLEFDKSIRAMEATRRATHPLRLELHSYFFTQALAGPHRGWLLASFLHAMVWISLVVLPVLIMLFTQVVFLPYHDQLITWVHRIVLSLDMAILLAVGVFLRRTEASFITALFRTIRRHPANVLITGSLFCIVLILSYFVATIPGEYLDTLRPKPIEKSSGKQAGVSPGFVISAAELLSDSRDGLKDVLENMFSRNLIVTNADLVPDKDDNDAAREFSIILRNRDLREAILNRTDLHRADLAGADLRGAKLIETDLRMANLTCSHEKEAFKEEDTKGRENRRKCVKLDDADLTDARLDGAKMAGASLIRATLIRTKLPGADLASANLTAALMNDADMRRARLSDEVILFGAEMPGANLRGAYLGGVNLQGANLSSAKLQGAYMAWVNASAANLSSAELDGAYMESAQLQGANLENASMLGTDLSNAVIWQTQPPSPFVFRLARTGGLNMVAPTPEDLNALREILKQIPRTSLSYNISRQRLSALLDLETASQWADSIDHSTWLQLKDADAGTSQDYRTKITAFLGVLACQVRWRDGSVADGVISRALSSNFGGDTGQVYRRVTGAACPASGNLSQDLVSELAGVVEERANEMGNALVPETPVPAQAEN